MMLGAGRIAYERLSTKLLPRPSGVKVGLVATKIEGESGSTDIHQRTAGKATSQKSMTLEWISLWTTVRDILRIIVATDIENHSIP